MYNHLLTTPWTELIHQMFERSFKKEWYETYWVFDMHNTIIKSTYDLNDKSVILYPYAKEVMQYLTKRDDIKTIMWTSSYPHEIEEYAKKLARLDIVFDRINENPDISSNNGNFGFYEKKFYFNLLFDDKAAFFPDRDWKPIYELLMEYEKNGYVPNPRWSKKY